MTRHSGQLEDDVPDDDAHAVGDGHRRRRQDFDNARCHDRRGRSGTKAPPLEGEVLFQRAYGAINRCQTLSALVMGRLLATKCVAPRSVERIGRHVPAEESLEERAGGARVRALIHARQQIGLR